MKLCEPSILQNEMASISERNSLNQQIYRRCHSGDMWHRTCETFDHEPGVNETRFLSKSETRGLGIRRCAADSTIGLCRSFACQACTEAAMLGIDLAAPICRAVRMVCVQDSVDRAEVYRAVGSDNRIRTWRHRPRKIHVGT